MCQKCGINDLKKFKTDRDIKGFKRKKYIFINK